MKKAQMEIIGLMLIILFLAILAVFFLRFALKPDTSYISEARQSVLASATVDSIIKTSYNNQTFENLIYDCYTGFSCNILEKEIKDIMPKITSKKPYYYTFSSNEQVFLEFGDICKTGIQSNKIYIINKIPTEISLKLC